MRFHPTRGSMSLSEKDGGLPPDDVVADDDDVQGISGRRELREKLIRLYASVGQYSGRPAQSQLDAIPVYETGIAEVRAEWEAFLAERLNDLNERLAKDELEPLEILSEDEFRESEG